MKSMLRHFANRDGRARKEGEKKGEERKCNGLHVYRKRAVIVEE